jgi:hypothetical protein
MTVKTMIGDACDRKVAAIDAAAKPRLEALKKSIDFETASARRRLLRSVTAAAREHGATIGESRMELCIAWSKGDGKYSQFRMQPTALMRKLKTEQQHVQDCVHRDITAVRCKAAALQQSYFLCGKRAILPTLRAFCGIED